MLYKLHKDKTLFKAAYNLNEAIHMNFLRVVHLLSLHNKPSVLYKKEGKKNQHQAHVDSNLELKHYAPWIFHIVRKTIFLLKFISLC